MRGFLHPTWDETLAALAVYGHRQANAKGENSSTKPSYKKHAARAAGKRARDSRRRNRGGK